MATTEYIRYPNTSAAGGVTSLNTLTGDLTLAAGSGITITPAGSTLTIASTSSGGTVTSVALALPASVFTVSGSPVTGSGTLTGSFSSQSANQFFAAPNGSSGTPTFRAIVAADIPTLNQNTTGTAANITASSNNTLTTLSSLSLPGSQVSGNIPGNAVNVTASSNSSLTTLSALSLPGAQVTGNISGNAANITASSNSTISTLTLLSLPGAQVTGNIAGNAANITASSNSTLTTLSALSLPGSQVSGNISGNASNVTGTVAIANGGTGQTTQISAFDALSPNTTKADIIVYSGTHNVRLPIGTNGQVLTADSGQTNGLAWEDPSSNLTGSYSQAYVSSPTTTWTSTSNVTFNDGTISGSNAVTVRKSSGITVTAGASNVCGITFSPVNASAIYLITVVYSAYNSTAGGSSSYQLTDGTTIISGVGYFEQEAAGNDVVVTETLSGVYTPGTTSPVTVKLQLVGTTAQILTNGATPVEWTVTQMSTSAASGVTSLTGDVTGTGPGATATTIAAAAVTNSKIANSTIDLTTKVTGTLPVANGGTGAASFTANDVLLGNGTSAFQVVAPGTSGNVLTSNGTTWSSSAPAGFVAVNFMASESGSLSITANSPVQFATTNFDTNSGYSASTGNYTVPTTGVYQIFGAVNVNATNNIFIVVNGSTYAKGIQAFAAEVGYVSAIASITSGQTVSIQMGSSGTTTGGVTLNYFSVYRIG